MATRALSGPRWAGLATGAVALGLLGLLAMALPSPQTLWRNASQLSASVWGVSIAGWLASYACRAQRLHGEWAGRTGMRWRDALHVTLLHSAAINLVPMRAGEACFPWLMQRRWRVAPGDAVASLLWLRVQDAVVLLVLAAAALLPWGHWPWRLGLALLLLAVLAQALPVWAGRVSRQRGQGWRGIVARGLAPLAAARGASWGWSTANWAVKSWASAHAVAALLTLAGPPASSWACWPAGLTAELGGALPVQVPSGFGAWEAGFWLGLQSAGLAAWPSAEVLGAGLTAHVALMLVGCGAAVAAQGVWGRKT